MKNIFTLVLLGLLCHTSSIAQKTPTKIYNLQNANLQSSLPQTTPLPSSINGDDKGDRCGFVIQRENAIANGYMQDDFENIIAQKVEEIKRQRVLNRTTATTNYVLPVIFHIIHDGTAEGTGANISQSQILEQISQLNKDFGNQSGSPFGVAANTGISFCPALIDPANATLAQPGINRINRITRGWTDPTTFGSSNAQQNAMVSYINSTIKANSIWDPTKYVNIWLYNFSNSGLLGYATFPTAGPPDLPAGGETATTAGCVFLSGAAGSLSSPGSAGAKYGLGRTVTHEVGHFLGLYHVWGDVTTCSGTDYCADTPPCSDQYFSAVPTCTVPVQCSSLPRMIENYMDYSDDACMNTYTQNQTDRIQAVMLVAPRRPNNPGATLCTPPVANAVSFTTSAITVTETGVGSACPKFKDISVLVQPAIAASGNATVTLTLGGTATQNVDYQVIGTTSVNYVNGESVAKGFTIRIWDDAEQEPSETITASFTITGSGLVAGSTNQGYTATITDDDVNQGIDNTNATITLFSENFGTTSTGGVLPTGWLKGNFLATAGSNVFTANAVSGSATGFGSEGRFLHITNGNAANQTNENAANTYTASSTSDVAAITPNINTTGRSNLTLNFDYACPGESDAGGLYDYGVILYSTSATQGTGLNVLRDAMGNIIYLANGTVAKTAASYALPAECNNQANLYIGFRWINDGSVRTPPGLTVDNIIVTAANAGVETAAAASITQINNSGQLEQYRSAANKIIVLTSALNENIGCITATISAAGTGTKPLVTPSGSYLRSDKVVQVSPAITNSTASYTLTLYYTTAELATWGTISNLKVLKVKDGVNLAGSINSSDATVFTPVVDDQRAAKGFASFTINATGGFSQFMLASPNIVLPVSLLSFSAAPGKGCIDLQWKTTNEIDNKGFYIERSTNAINFVTIGFAAADLAVSSVHQYRYQDVDVKTNTIYYYRLKQVNNNANFSYSETRNAALSQSGIFVSVSPNPASTFINVEVIGKSGQANFTLKSIEGKSILRQSQYVRGNSIYSLQLGNLASGVYILLTEMEGVKNSQKVIIQ